MPYGKRYSRRKRGVRRSSNLRRAWKAKRRPRKASALVRQTEANRKNIKKLKSHIETKRADAFGASLSGNWCGQVLAKAVPVDNYGMSQSSQDYVTLSTQTPNTYLPKERYSPLWQMPIVVRQGDGEHERIGNQISMKNLVIKGQMQGGFSDQNAGIYKGLAIPQTLHMYVILDTAPVPENSTLAGQSPFTWDQYAMPGQTFSFANNWNPLLPAGFSIPQVRNLQPLKNLILGTANPPGLATCRGTKDLLNLSYWSTDESGIGKDNRYRLIKHFKYQCTQHPPSSAIGANVQNKTDVKKFTRDFSETIKLPYKFTFASDENIVPNNQQLFLVFVSETPTCRNSGAVAPTDFVMPPAVTTHCRLNFTSA